MQGARLREKSEKQAAGDEISEVSEESDIDEELGYMSPLDNMDPYIAFNRALTSTLMPYPFPPALLTMVRSFPNEGRPQLPTRHDKSRAGAANSVDGGYAPG